MTPDLTLWLTSNSLECHSDFQEFAQRCLLLVISCGSVVLTFCLQNLQCFPVRVSGMLSSKGPGGGWAGPGLLLAYVTEGTILQGSTRGCSVAAALVSSNSFLFPSACHVDTADPNGKRRSEPLSGCCLSHLIYSSSWNPWLL